MKPSSRSVLSFAVATWSVVWCWRAAPDAEQPAELIVRNGLVVTAEGRSNADIRIRNGTIAEIGPKLASSDGVREIDARGLVVVPGAVDPHVHLGGPPAVDDYTSGSAAALAGGITTISNFVSPRPDEAALAAVKRADEQIRTQAIADVLIHVTVGAPESVTPAHLSALADAGYTSLKIFMVRPAFDLNAPKFLELIRAAGQNGIITMLHAEDASIVQTASDRLMAEGRGSLRYFAESRPVVAEELATARAAAISEATGAPIYVVHLSSERALRAAEAGQARGLPLYVETRPLYLNMTDDKYAQYGDKVGLLMGQPPLRKKRDVDAVWEGMAKGTVHVLASDHVAYTRAQKLDPTLTVVNSRPGMNLIQTMHPMLYSQGVRTKRITLERFVAITSTNPAKLFGLYPRKGAIAVGSDADLALWDPEVTRTVRDEDMLSKSGYSIYSGEQVTGWPRLVIRRGDVVYENGKVTGAPGSGRLLQSQRWKRPALGLASADRGARQLR